MTKTSKQHHFIIGSSHECTCVLTDSSVRKNHLLITPISEFEYLIRDISDGGKTIVDRQHIVMARANKNTSVQLGEKTYTLEKLLPTHTKPTGTTPVSIISSASE